MSALSCSTHRLLPIRARRRRLRKRDRLGAIVTIEMIVALPIVVAFALTILQFMLIGSAHYRVQAAAVAAAEAAADGASIEKVHEAAGGMLGPHLQQLYQTEMEYTAKERRNYADPQDSVVVSVRIPMLAASRNYLGLFGGDISPLHIKAVAEKKISKPGGFPLPAH